ncbi:MAG: glutamine amidotransferase [Gammaproteobacteria bacterium]|nr:glutamine amidotransferase [Gammaproteobacteria bacterium]
MTSAKPVLILQLRPEDVTADSEYACFLKYGGLKAEDTRRLRIEQTGIPDDLDPDAYSAIIVGGSPFDLSLPDEDKPDIQKRIEVGFHRLLEHVVTRDIPFLGACSGNGLLGSYLGAPLSGNHREPVSCVTLDVTAAGKSDPLLAGFPDQIDVLLGHKEALDALPDGATLLLKGHDCPVQMFRVGENVYATQFHPEGDAEEFCLRIDIYRDYGYFDPKEADTLKRNVSLRPTPYAQEMLRRFVARYCRRTPNA